MFTAMTRRPLVWLLALLALSGVGWLVYERRDAPESVARSAGPQPAIEEAAPRPAAPGDTAALGPPATATPGGTGEAPAPAALSTPGSEPPASPAPEPDQSPRPTTAGPGASGDPASPPGAPAVTAGGPPVSPDPAAGEESAVSAAPALAPKAEANAPTAPEAAAASGQAAPSAPAVDPTPPPSATRDVDWARLRALAPGAPPAAEPRDQPDPQSDAAASPARTEAAPAAAAAPREEPAPARAAALEEEPAPVGPTTLPDQTESAGAPPTPTGAPSEGTRRGPDSPAVESGAPPSAAAPGATAAERPAGVPRVLASIRRTLAALLGGSPDPSDPTLPGAVVIDRSSDGLGSEPTGSGGEPTGSGGEPTDRAPSAAPAQDVAAGEPEVVRPSFDIVRVERDGRAVVAGRAAPGAEVELRTGDRVLDRVRASARGEWVAIPPEPLAAGGQELTVAARSAGSPALEADQVAVVAVPEPAAAKPAVGGEAAREAVAMLLPRDGRGNGRILQAPGRISGDGELALLVLDYDDSGRIRLTGEAPPGAPVRIYVDNQPSSELVVEPSGRWTATLEHKLAPGDYMLRLDQLGGEGRPVARLETPFTRVSQPPVAGAAEVDYVVVQPGNSLWRIARRLFGAGFKYVHIYDANQAQIRNPDLIYPGQVFEVPAAAGAAG
jgi:nucleoid-associated protein YgaU